MIAAQTGGHLLRNVSIQKQNTHNTMAKIAVNQVAEILKRNDLDPALLRQIVEEMNQAVEPDLDEERQPSVKKQFSIVISDPDNVLPEKHEFTGWIFQIPEDESVTSTTERIHKAAYEFNTTKRGRMMPAKTMADAIENIPAKVFKEQQIWVKTKAPVFVIRTDNEIPTETTEKSVTMTLKHDDKEVTVTSEQLRRAADRLAQA